MSDQVRELRDSTEYAHNAPVRTIAPSSGGVPGIGSASTTT